MAITDFLGNLSSSNFTAVFGGIGLIVVIFVIWYSFRNYGLRFGTLGESRALKKLEYTPLGSEFTTGRRLLRTLRQGIRTTSKVEKEARKVENRRNSLERNLGETNKEVITGEERILESELHSISAGAGFLELGEVIFKLANSEMNEHKAMERIEAQLKALDSSLAQYSKFGLVEREGQSAVSQLAQEVLRALATLALLKSVNLTSANKTFSEAESILRLIADAETRARTIERNAIQNEKKVIDFLEADLKSIRNHFENKRNDAEYGFGNRPFDAYREGGEYDTYNKLVKATKNYEALNYRIIKVIRGIKENITAVLVTISSALEMGEQLRAELKTLAKDAEKLRKNGEKAASLRNSIYNEPTEEIIIQVAESASSILSAIIEITAKVRDIESQLLLPLFDKVRTALKIAYQVEETERLLGDYDGKIIEINRALLGMTKSMEALLGMTKSMEQNPTILNFLVEEIKVDEIIENEVASKMANISSAAKSLFIRAWHAINNAHQTLQQQIDYLRNSIMLTEDTKQYTLDVLGSIMAIIHQHKIRNNNEFEAKAQEFQAKFNQAASKQNLVKVQQDILSLAA